MQKYQARIIENKWKNFWISNQIYKFETSNDKEIFSIENPPPTIIGKVHLGQAIGYTQLDFIARYKRLKGYNVFFPFGFDNYSLPTKLLIERIIGKKENEVDRIEFMSLCINESKKLERILKEQWQSLGISADWNLAYSSLEKKSRETAQKVFIYYCKNKITYLRDSAYMFCPKCKKVVSQKETKHIKTKAKVFNVVFNIEESNEKIVVPTIYPELLAASVAIIINPKNNKLKRLIGKKAIVPLFEYKIPIIKDEEIKKDIRLVQTFGDNTDLQLSLKHNLKVRNILDDNLKLNKLTGHFEGLTLENAKQAIVDVLKHKNLITRENYIDTEQRVHVECNSKIVFKTKKQWFLKTTELKGNLLKSLENLKFYPKFFKKRVKNQILNLKWDWNISRQRSFGVPIPVWYCKKCGNVILAKEDQIPVDPTIDNPPLEKCPICGSEEFIPETDIFDSWFTNSLNMFVEGNWIDDRGFFTRIFPYDIRLNGHDIVDIWTPYSLVHSLLLENKISWKKILVNGFLIDKSSKKNIYGDTKGIFDILNIYGGDAIRYWIATKNFGYDIIYDENKLRKGKKLINKLWNLAYIIKELSDRIDNKDTILRNVVCENLIDSKKQNQNEIIKNLNVLDRWLLYKRDLVLRKINKSLEGYKFADVIKEIEIFLTKDFANFYVNILKKKERDDKTKNSIVITLIVFLDILKILSIFMPFITEEIFHLVFIKKSDESIHKSNWPKEYSVSKIEDYDCGELLKDIVKETRRQKDIKKRVKKIRLYFPNDKYKKMFDKINEEFKMLTKINEIIISEEELPKKSKIYMIGVMIE